MPDVPKFKPVTDTKIPGTDIPDVTQSPEFRESERQKSWMARVAVSTSVMAALAAISSSMATGNLNQAMLQQIREADKWSFYQAKSVKESVLEGRLDTATALNAPVTDADRAKLARYGQEKEAIKKEAEECGMLGQRCLHRYTHTSRAATAAQIGIALAAVALLLRKNLYWALSLIAGVAGAAFFIVGLLAS